MLISMPESTTKCGPGRPKDLLKRMSILNAAKQVFLKYGYEAGSVDTIAIEAGVSKTTVYRHFVDKETLLAAVIEEPYDKQLPLRLFNSGEDIPIVQALYNIALGLEKPDFIELYRLIAIQEVCFPKQAKLFYQRVYGILFSEMKSFLERAHNQGKLHIPNIAFAAEYFLSAFYRREQFRRRIEVEYEVDEWIQIVHQEYAQEVVYRFVRAYSI